MSACSMTTIEATPNHRGTDGFHPECQLTERGSEDGVQRAESVPAAHSRVLVALAAVLLAVGGVTPAESAPAGLNAIPTEDIYEPGRISIEWQAQGLGRVLGSECDEFLLLQAGVTRALDVGVDRCLSESGEPLLFNGKFRLMEGRGLAPALAIGVQNLARRELLQPYAVAGWTPVGSLRGHVGAIAIERAPAAMAGVDATWRSLTGQLDWISGSDGMALAGMSWSPWPNVSATYAVTLAGSSSSLSSHTLNVQFLTSVR